jgi:hypothetical protein
MPVMARKTSEKTAGGKEGDMILFPEGKEGLCPLFPQGSASEYDAASTGRCDTAAEGL